MSITALFCYWMALIFAFVADWRIGVAFVFLGSHLGVVSKLDKERLRTAVALSKGRDAELATAVLRANYSKDLHNITELEEIENWEAL